MTSDKIGRYEIVHKIARGGMAIVYLAKDSYMERLVAVKVLPRVFMHDPQFEKRFTREARVVASLEHPAIVPVYDFGYHDEQPFMVYRFMSGGTLKDKIQNEGAKSLAGTAKLLSRLAPAIDKAHDKGIIHRDLKPSNILFDDDDKAYIADFGIAKIVESTSHLTGNAIVGTPAYMSPEQFTGDSDVGRYSDIYALGIILYELLSGELPFKADTTPRLMKLHIMDPVPSIREIRSELPNDIDAILGKALAKATEDRYQRVEELRTNFERVVSLISTVHADPEDLRVDEDATVREPKPILSRGRTPIEPVEQMAKKIPVESEFTPRGETPILEEEGLVESVQELPERVMSRLQIVIQTGINTALHEIKTLSKNKEFLAILLIGLGWSLGYAIGRYIMSTDELFYLSSLFMSVGAAGGISLALALKWLVPSLSWPRALIIAAGWFGAWASIWSISQALDVQPTWDIGIVLIQFLLSGIAGLITSLSLFWDDAKGRWKRSIIISLGWGAATAIGVMFSALTSVESWLSNYYLVDFAIGVDGLLANFTIGIIGASITLGQLRKTNLIVPETGVFEFSDTVVTLWREYRFAFILLLIAWPISQIVVSVLLVQLNYDTTWLFIIDGVLGAILTGFAIQRIQPGVRWFHVALFGVGWAVFWELRWNIADAYGIEQWGFNVGWSVIRLFAAALAGVTMGLVLRMSGVKLGWKSLVRIAGGWTLGWALATIISGYVQMATTLFFRWTTSFADVHIPWVLSTVFVGLFGGVYMVREILNLGSHKDKSEV